MSKDQRDVSHIDKGEINEPVAIRYDFDGNGYLYMDAESGSDWASRVKDCEFLYTKPIQNTEQLPVAWIKKEYSPDCGYFFNIYDHETDGYMPVFMHPPIKESLSTNIDWLERCIEQTQLIANLHQEIYLLKEKLEDCTCQGGHSEAYLKAKGKL